MTLETGLRMISSISGQRMFQDYLKMLANGSKLTLLISGRKTSSTSGKTHSMILRNGWNKSEMTLVTFSKMIRFGSGKKSSGLVYLHLHRRLGNGLN